jgi:ADP-dependent NAD(P)H-hydrate dehydratase / NAD(P)H-hydrate epimerase
MSINIEELKSKLKTRKKDSHKKDYGHIFVLAGSVGLTGAAILTCSAAMRSGAGLVTLGIPESLNNIIETKLTEVMSLPLPETQEQSFSLSGFHKIQQFSSKCNLITIGPGLSTYRETTELVHKIIRETDINIVLDADGINAFNQHNDLDNLKEHKSELIITPHPGEMAKLLKKDTAYVQENREKVAVDFAKEYNCVVVLKGNETIVADKEGNVYINNTGNSGLATAGSGDVLTGIISSFFVQGLSAYESAILGTYIHGDIADKLTLKTGELFLIASDIVDDLFLSL